MARLEDTLSNDDMIYGGSALSGLSILFEAGVSIGHGPSVGMAVGAMGIIFGGYMVCRGAMNHIGDKYIPLLEK